MPLNAATRPGMLKTVCAKGLRNKPRSRRPSPQGDRVVLHDGSPVCWIGDGNVQWMRTTLGGKAKTAGRDCSGYGTGPQIGRERNDVFAPHWRRVYSLAQYTHAQQDCASKSQSAVQRTRLPSKQPPSMAHKKAPPIFRLRGFCISKWRPVIDYFVSASFVSCTPFCPCA